MNILSMSKEDFLSVPMRSSFQEDIGWFSSLVIIPTNNVHDSGFMCMRFVAVNDDGQPVCGLGGGSDVIMIDGIFGFLPRGGWKIDCLPCGYLRLHCNGHLTVGHDVSTFEVFANE